ncbi:hypothetical protein NEPAR06_0466 [Nematocida parisii]|uniref:Uncharacterized protein n=1 Tax=Nematocida parisii (strain ERTm3) TaxID=935791 RepID=I3EJJ1_NEMP3|nr:uncharacterized protein NEPG_01082 [Nematocida parisii ERTm1]EIJ89388.1 hypothetical protein NEQG_00158 [Nematocida parisii ERTm3]KAI5131132.1 hypothetical protein NEPAR03_2302 [Nematocida parisii]EIJ94414.1 hypothetical protein NEPG_01082 [Nematocida parisii ERTm1]KAI5142615.1 hypothetical protein NEPAR07_0220 [Nematocida parisii]KAI5153466.1 hypothetical protein NEPAR06_0466 [Nematocida parisii]|eukprot:XP_013058910.1 hypothetical protein NEPG_01082 [Nematocida parisii ERTm1]
MEEPVELEINKIKIDFICLYNYIKILFIGVCPKNQNASLATDKDNVHNCIGTFVINVNDSLEEIEKKWLALPPIKYYNAYNSIYADNIIVVALYLILLKAFHVIEEKSAHALSNLIPTNIHPFLHEYVLSGNFLYTLLQIVSGSYIIMGLIEPVYWILRKSKNITKKILNPILFGLFAVAFAYTVYLIAMWMIFLILRLVEDYTIISNIIVYGYLFLKSLILYDHIYSVYKKRHSNRYIGEYIASILYTILLIMSIGAVIYTYSDNILKIIKYVVY